MNAGVATIAAAVAVVDARTVGYNHAPPRQHAAKTASVANSVDRRRGCRPKVPSRRIELIATKSVDPSCNSTASHSGNAPTSAGSDAPTMETTASVMFCRSTARVLAAKSNNSGSCEMPSASACSRSTSAAAAAASDGVDATATPTSAAANAGASLIPSPTIATFLHLIDESAAASARVRSTMRSLSPGVSPAFTSSAGRPTSRAIAAALSGLSPVSIKRRMPSPPRHAPSRSVDTAAAAFGCGESANRNTHAKFSERHASGSYASTSQNSSEEGKGTSTSSTTRAAATSPPRSDATAAARRRASARSGVPAISHAHSTLPNRANRGGPHSTPTTPGRTRPSTPYPCTTLKSLTATSGEAPDADADAAASSVARAMGCVAPRSRLAAMANAVGFDVGDDAIAFAVDRAD